MPDVTITAKLAGFAEAQKVLAAVARGFEVVGKSTRAVGDRLKAVGRDLTQFGRKVSFSISAPLGILAGLALRNDKAFRDAASSVKQAMTPALASLGSSLSGVLVPILEKLAEVVKRVSDWFNSLSPPAQRIISIMVLLGTAIGPVLIALGSMTGLVGSVLGVVGPLIASIGTLAISLGTTLVASFGTAITAAAGFAVTIGVAAASAGAIIGVGTAIGLALSNMGPLFDAAGKIAGNWSKRVVAAFTLAFEVAEGFATEGARGIDLAADAWVKYNNTVSPLVAENEKNFEALGGAAVDVLDNTKSDIIALGGIIADGFAEAVGDPLATLDVLKGALTGLGAGDAIAALTGAGGGALDSLLAAFDGLITKILGVQATAPKAGGALVESTEEARAAAAKLGEEWQKLAEERVADASMTAGEHIAQLAEKAAVSFASMQENWDETSAFLVEGLVRFGELGQEVLDTFIGGVGDAFASAIVEGEDLGAALQNVLKNVAKAVISTLIQIGIQQLINLAISLLTNTAQATAEGARAVGLAGANAYASIAAIPIIGPALAPAAAAAAIAGATAALTAGGAAGAGAGAAVGAAAGGLEDVPETGTFLLHRGERVLSPGQNQDLMEAVQGSVGGEMINTTVQFSGINVVDDLTRKAFVRDIEASVRRSRRRRF